MVPPNIPSLVLVSFANSICVVVATGFLAFNLYYRHNRLVYSEFASLQLNHMIMNTKGFTLKCFDGYTCSVDFCGKGDTILKLSSIQVLRKYRCFEGLGIYAIIIGFHF